MLIEHKHTNTKNIRQFIKQTYEWGYLFCNTGNWYLK